MNKIDFLFLLAVIHEHAHGCTHTPPPPSTTVAAHYHRHRWFFSHRSGPAAKAARSPPSFFLANASPPYPATAVVLRHRQLVAVCLLPSSPAAAMAAALSVEPRESRATGTATKSIIYSPRSLLFLSINRKIKRSKFTASRCVLGLLTLVWRVKGVQSLRWAEFGFYWLKEDPPTLPFVLFTLNTAAQKKSYKFGAIITLVPSLWYLIFVYFLFNLIHISSSWVWHFPPQHIT